jgi:D-serine deaminase-like pyridoxal phosphate-dependent protein
VLGRPSLQVRAPSEEHLPIDIPAGEDVPKIGEVVYLIPRHVCPTISNFDEGILVASHQIVGVEPVSARGHEPALVNSATANSVAQKD